MFRDRMKFKEKKKFYKGVKNWGTRVLHPGSEGLRDVGKR